MLTTRDDRVAPGPPFRGAASGAAQGAAALAVERDLPTPKQQWEQSMGKLLGGRLFDLVTRHVSTEQFMELGKRALERASNHVSNSLKLAMESGTLADRANAQKVSDMLRAELRPLAASFMTNGAGADLARALSDVMHSSPLGAVSAIILAAALAIATDQPVPEIRKSFGLGEGLSVQLNAQVGTFKHMMLESLAAELSYERSGLKTKVGWERMAGPRAQKALAAIQPQYVAGAIDDHATVDRLSADVAFQLRSLQNGNAQVSAEAYLKDGQMLKGSVGAQLGFTAAPGLQVNANATATQTAGAALGGAAGVGMSYQPNPRESYSASVSAGLGANSGTGTAALNLSYQPSKHESYTLGVTQGFGPGNAGTALNFRMQLDEHLHFEGRYDKANGAYVGVVYKIPL